MKTIFDLEMLFQLTPSIAGARGIDNHNSIGTNTTGVTNTTKQIMEEAISTRFEKVIEVNDYTVTSGLMEPTVYTPPQQPKDSSVNLDNQLAPMVLEGQKGG